MKILIITTILITSSVMAIDPSIYHYANPVELMSQDPLPLHPGAPLPNGEELEEPEYEDCTIAANGTIQPPAEQIPNYKCYPSRNPDLIDNDNGEIPEHGEIDNLLLRMLRKNLLGITSETDLNSGREPFQSCYEEIIENPLASNIFYMYDEDLEGSVVGTEVSEKLATPRVPPMVDPNNVTQMQAFLSLGCRTNRCAPKVGEATDPNAPYAHYECKPRFSYRCLGPGEFTTDSDSCCPGLQKNANNLCETPVIPQESILEGFPDHVDPSTGLIQFSDDEEVRKIVGGKIGQAITSVRAFEFFFSEQNTGSRKKVPDNKVMKDLGARFKESMLKALDNYNKDLEELNELKDSFVTLSKQTNDPEEYYLSQGSVSYRNREFQSAEDFKRFVQNATSGSEIFRLMADEQRIQLKYEYTVYQAILDAIKGGDNKNLEYLLKEWDNRSAGRSGESNIFGHSFTYRKRRTFKKRWDVRYKIRGSARSALKEKMLESPQVENRALQIRKENPAYSENAAKLTSLSELNIFPKYLIESYLVNGMNDGDYGGGGAKRKILKSTGDMNKIVNDLQEKFRQYVKTNYFSRGNEFFDISLGGLKECLTDNDFPIKKTEYCLKYKNNLEVIEFDVVQMFIKASAGSRKYYGSTIGKKKKFFSEQISKLTHAMGIYEHLSAIPAAWGGLSFFSYTNHDYQKLFDEYNEVIPGFLRMKSYLFYMAKAKKLEQDLIADTGIDTGGGTSPDGNLYGSGNSVINNTGQLNQNGTQIQNAITSGLSPSQALALNSGSLTGAGSDINGSRIQGAGFGQAGSDYSRSLARLNKPADEFAQKNPQLRSTLSQLAKASRQVGNENFSDLSDQISNGISGAGSPLASVQGAGLAKLNKEDKGSNKSQNTSQFIQYTTTNNISSSVPTSLYKESSNNKGDRNQLTGLSDYQLAQAIKNSKDQAHLYKSSEFDGIFEKISKTYARNYSRFLVKKKSLNHIEEGSSIQEAKQNKKEVMEMLDGF